MAGDKECFVICPIGSEGSDTRERSDKLMEHIIKEAVEEYGYTAVRADQMTDPGSITSQVIQKVVDADLVIADLTGHNPNVFYELAVRHAAAKPYIQLIDSTDTIPFDISDLRTIKYDFDVSNASRASEEIQEHLRTMEEEDPEFDNPISRSADFKSWRESGDPMQQNLADVLDGINTLNKRMDYIENLIAHGVESQATVEQIWKRIDQSEDEQDELNKFKKVLYLLGKDLEDDHQLTP